MGEWMEWESGWNGRVSGMGEWMEWESGWSGRVDGVGECNKRRDLDRLRAIHCTTDHKKECRALSTTRNLTLTLVVR